jgi:hypothetical protein
MPTLNAEQAKQHAARLAGDEPVLLAAIQKGHRTLHRRATVRAPHDQGVCGYCLVTLSLPGGPGAPLATCGDEEAPCSRVFRFADFD